MTQMFLQRLKRWIASGNVHRFYLTGEWKSKSAEVLKLDKNECQIHKERGRYRKAELVHHEKHVKKFPELALEIYYIDSDGQRKRNLRSVCKECHEYVCHPERLKKKSKPKFTTQERWD